MGRPGASIEQKEASVWRRGSWSAVVRGQGARGGGHTGSSAGGPGRTLGTASVSQHLTHAPFPGPTLPLQLRPASSCQSVSAPVAPAGRSSVAPGLKQPSPACLPNPSMIPLRPQLLSFLVLQEYLPVLPMTPRPCECRDGAMALPGGTGWPRMEWMSECSGGCCSASRMEGSDETLR